MSKHNLQLKDSCTICPVGGLPTALQVVGITLRVTTAKGSMSFKTTGATPYMAFAKGVKLQTILEGACKAAPMAAEIEVVGEE
jgi:hypothetical protein